MAFTWLNKQGVKSSKGFIVQCVARFLIEYREDSKCLSIDVESDYAPGAGSKPQEIIRKSTLIHWDDNSPITTEKRDEIIKNFKDAMEFQGVGVIVED